MVPRRPIQEKGKGVVRVFCWIFLAHSIDETGHYRRKLSEAMINAPYDMAKGKFVCLNFDRIKLQTKHSCIVKDEGNAEPCFVSACLEQNKTASGQGLSEELIKDTAAVAWSD